MPDDVAVQVNSVSKTFKLPHEKNTTIKSAVINFYKRNRTFENQLALKDISFEIKKGEFFGIVGRNGSGKSTLLKVLAGIYTPTKGTIEVNGKLIPFIELGVGFSPELTGRENVFLNGSLLGFSRKEMMGMYDEIVEFSEIERFMDQKLKNYSSGMQVRLAFSIAIRAKGDILLLDEVLAVGDASFQQKCYDYFEELKRDNKTVIFVSHDMGAVRRFCTKAVYIKDSELIFQGKPSEVAEMYVEENMENTRQIAKKSKAPVSSAHHISIKLLNQTKENVTLSIAYKSADKEEVYIGISVIKDGISIAEINTIRQLTLIGSGEITYTLETGIFNAGAYYVTAALFKLKNKELIAVSKNKGDFTVKGKESDADTKGAAVKLEDTWKQA